MTVTKKTTHAEEAKDTLISQFKPKPKLRAMVGSYANEVQELEDTFDDIRAISNVDNSNDAQLDTIGAIVGERRQGRGDIEYRTAIKTRINLNISSGTEEQIRALIRGVAGDVQVNIIDQFPAAFLAVITDPIDPLLVDPARIALFVKSGSGAGIGAQTAVHVTGPFQYDTGLGYDEGKYGAVF